MLSNENKTNDTPLSREGASDITLSGDNLSDSGLSAGASLLGETPEVSMAVSRALADSLAKIAAYVPTTWVDNTEPDIDAEHLNHVEQGIMRVTNLMNSAVDVIKDLQTQVTTLNGESALRYAGIDFIYTENALGKVDDPTLIFGTARYCPYIILFTDNTGTSPFQGGTTFILGYTYPNNQYGAQLSMRYNGIPQYRNKNREWSEWKKFQLITQ